MYKTDVVDNLTNLREELKKGSENWSNSNRKRGSLNESHSF